jgi:alpha-beta hydrolase superfamily lysophospholipase
MERSAARPPDREGTHDGLAYRLWLPGHGEAPAVVIVHGAGSRKENHTDFARVATAAGWGALAFDLPGHGSSNSEMSGNAVEDVIEMARLLGEQDGVDARRVAVRGSSLGGFLAIHAAGAASEEIAGVIAICPADEKELARGVRAGRFEMRIGDPLGLEAWLTATDSGAAVERIAGRPLILMHAEGDIQVPFDHSEALYSRAGDPRKLVIVPGGTHTSVQHDAELQATALLWLERNLRDG